MSPLPWLCADPYEQVASIPFYMRWPHSIESRVLISRGTILDQLVELRDVFPTLAEVAGLPTGYLGIGPDGTSLLRLLQTPNTSTWRSHLLLELANCGFNNSNWAAITDAHSKYIRDLGTGQEHLFNLSSDQYEEDDLASERSSHAALELWRKKLAHEFEREGRGPAWVSNGTLHVGGNCTSFQITDGYQQHPPLPPTKLATSRRVRANIVLFITDGEAVRCSRFIAVAQTAWQ